MFNSTKRLAYSLLCPFLLLPHCFAHSLERLNVQDGIYILNLEGSWYDIGSQFGESLSNYQAPGSKIRRNLLEEQYKKIKEYVSKYNNLTDSEAENNIKNRMQNYLDLSSSALNQHQSDLLQAISHTTGMPIWKILAISYPFDFGVDTNTPNAPNCSFIGIRSQKEIIAGRNMDWVQSMKPTLEPLLVTIYHPTEDNPKNNSAYSVGHIGMLGASTGGNSRGLFLELNSAHLSVGDIVNTSVTAYPLQVLDMLIASDNLEELKGQVTDWKNHKPDWGYTVSIVGFDPLEKQSNMYSIEVTPVVKNELGINPENSFYKVRTDTTPTIFLNDTGDNSHPHLLVSTNVFRLPDWDNVLPEENSLTHQKVFPYAKMEKFHSGDPNDFCNDQYGSSCCAGSGADRCFDSAPPTRSMSFFRYNNLLALGKENSDINVEKMEKILERPLSLEAGIGGATEDFQMDDFVQRYNNDYTYYQTIYDTKQPKTIFVRIPYTTEISQNSLKPEWIEIDLKKYGL